MPSRTASTVLRSLVAEARGRPRWDEPPALYFIYMSRGQARLEKAPVPDWAWVPEPAAGLFALASSAAERAAARPKPGLHAVAFRGEAWLAEAELGTPQAGELARDATARRVRYRADRREVRQVTAVDRGGSTYEVTLYRDTGETLTHVRAQGQVQAATGAVPDALDLLIRAYLGISLPPRGDFPAPGR